MQLLLGRLICRYVCLPLVASLPSYSCLLAMGFPSNYHLIVYTASSGKVLLFRSFLGVFLKPGVFDRYL